MGNDWVEVADRCFVRRYPEWDLSVTVTAGSEASLVVDTRATAAHGAELRAQVAELPVPPVGFVVNTHVHFDHAWGTAAFAGLPVGAHDNVLADWDSYVARFRGSVRDAPDEAATRALLDTPLAPPDRSVTSVALLELGERHVELVHPGRGHTDGDLVVVVPDTDLLCAGDLVEQSGPLWYGVDCWPLEWAQTLELVVGLMSDATVVVPGHGDRVDKDFVLQQRLDASDIAGQIQQLAASGVAVDDALARGTWPIAAERLGDAVRRGYAHLGR
ncbi:MAG: MBL fold metallo-hydrolase [Actinomycetota bacterium]|nr:MBL fold metallo-hydrolase [Actinomycetota bacterium]